MSLEHQRWQRLGALFDRALTLGADDRRALLDDLRRRDPVLAGELEALLDSRHGSGETTLTGPPMRTHRTAAPGDPPPPAPAIGPSPPGAGLRVGPWELIAKIGEGGMGQVWRARRADGLYDAEAAIKLLRSDLQAPGLAERFARERVVLARLSHPGVARLLDAGVDAGQAYLVLEQVEGRPLAEHVRAACPTVAERVRLLVQVGEAVAHAHAQLIVHRDLKPSNVRVTPLGEPKLLDFGIAGLLDDTDTGELTRLTGRGLTPGYSAPEQVLGAPIGTAADVFSLGVMLFELLGGELPFAPRGSGRVAAEHAVLHAEPRRLAAVLATAPSDAGPGRPVDADRARGDLEAVAAKALRKDPAARYGSVREWLDDLGHWLAHRPVSVRRDDWRHRARLFVRRHAVLAGSAALVLACLGAGLAVATAESRRALQAARQSDRVARYLTELLASADPERHGGQWPTVLELLESSRSGLSSRFRDDPDTRLRLLQALADTYHALNRFDIAMPLYDELVALATERQGEGSRTALLARLNRARTHQVQGLFDRAITALEPMQQSVAETFGAGSEEHRRLLYVLSTSYTRSGRLDEADRMLAELGRLTDARFPPGSPERLSHLNHLQVQRVGQGRLSEGLAALRATQPYWGDPRSGTPSQHLVLRRNTIAVQIRLSDYERIEERTFELLADMDRLLGPGNDMSAGLRQELARYYTDIGDVTRALALREDILARARAAQVEHPAVLLPLRVAVLLARAQAHTGSAGALVRDAHDLLAEMDRERARLGYGRADAWINLARVGLLLDDAALAAEALSRLQGDRGLGLDRDTLLASRVAQLDGELARLRGDLPLSRTLLRQRMQVFERPGDRRILPAWVAALDLAYTLVLMGDAQAPAALAEAAARRPPGVPPQHPLDAVQAWLGARLAAGRDDAPEVAAALQALRRLQGRPAGSPAGAGLGSFGGALL